MTQPMEATSKTVPAPEYVGGQGSTLVLLHGIGATWEVWKPVLPALEARHRVIAMTLPGHYGAPAYAGGGDATVAGLADQVIAMLRARGIDRAHVVGNSLGGWLSVELARRHFARSVVAFSPAGGWRSDQDYRAVARSLKIFYALVGLMLFLLAPLARFGWLRKALAKQMMEHGERFPAADFCASLRAMSRTSVVPGLLRTMGRDGPVAPMDTEDVAVRIAWSECDHVIPFERYGQPFVERIRGAEMTLVRGVGHVPMYDDPEQVVATIVEVTGRVDRAEEVTT
jgi:pimeloyl-ACP methyl ester carboxylesterase